MLEKIYNHSYINVKFRQIIHFHFSLQTAQLYTFTANALPVPRHQRLPRHAANFTNHRTCNSSPLQTRPITRHVLPYSLLLPGDAAALYIKGVSSRWPTFRWRLSVFLSQRFSLFFGQTQLSGLLFTSETGFFFFFFWWPGFLMSNIVCYWSAELQYEINFFRVFLCKLYKYNPSLLTNKTRVFSRVTINWIFHSHKYAASVLSLDTFSYSARLVGSSLVKRNITAFRTISSAS